MKKRVIICGYPKSGNTWLTRLTAQILSCPVAGFWSEPFNREEAIEGTNRISEFECFKAHQKRDDLEHSLKINGNGAEKVIYVYRDPRAVAVSASHYFLLPKYRKIYSLLEQMPKGSSFYHKFLHSTSHSLDRIVEGMIQGTNEGAWLGEPWLKHVKSYIHRSDTLVLSYEALSRDPMSAAKQIAAFLSVNRSEKELEEAIHKQSFERKKKTFESDSNIRKASFLRKGEPQAWRTELPRHHIRYIENNAGELMTNLGFQLISKS